jgi:L-fuculose-phosphate aldolase
MGFEETKYEVAVANRILEAVGLATGVTVSSGHASLRVPNAQDLFIVKGRGYKNDWLSKMRPKDMIVCDLEGNKVEGPEKATQCMEVKMHSTIYKTHPEVQSIVHVHPQFTVLASTLGMRLRPMGHGSGGNVGIEMVQGELPLYPHARTVTTEEQGSEVAAMLGSSKAILLQGHGAATVGKTLEESVMNMVQLEEQARMNWYARCAYGADYPYIPDELIEEFNEGVSTFELPHFKVARPSGARRPGGVWAYYTDLVTQDR